MEDSEYQISDSIDIKDEPIHEDTHEPIPLDGVLIKQEIVEDLEIEQTVQPPEFVAVKTESNYDVIGCENSELNQSETESVQIENSESIKCAKCFKDLPYKNCTRFHTCIERNETNYKVIYNFPCKFCNESFVNILEFDKHVKEIHIGCKLCDIKFENESQYESHEMNHISGSICFYQCSICFKEFKMENDTINHIIKIHKITQDMQQIKKLYGIFKKIILKRITFSNKYPICIYCNVNFATTKHLLKHLQDQHDIIPCKQCKNHFVNNDIETESVEHIINVSSTLSNVIEKCVYCGADYDSKFLADHKEKRHKVHLCKTCKIEFKPNIKSSASECINCRVEAEVKPACSITKVYSNPPDVNSSTTKRVDSILGIKLHDTFYCCNECTEQFYNNCSLQIHIMTIHKGIGIEHPEYIKDNKIEYKCPICLSVFTDSSLFYLHCFPYTIFPTFSRFTSICDLKIGNKRPLVELEDGSKYVCCKICKNYVKDIKTHIAFAHEGKIVHCTFCNTDYTLERYLGSHIDSCNLCICPFCSRNKYISKEDYKTHVVSHLKELKSEFCCKICFKYFYFEKDIKEHIKRKHRITLNDIINLHILKQSKGDNGLSFIIMDDETDDETDDEMLEIQPCSSSEQISESKVINDLINTLDNKNIFQCQMNKICKKLFSNLCSYMLHILRQHKASGKNSFSIKDPKIKIGGKEAFKCQICSLIFTEPNLFYLHCHPYTMFPTLAFQCNSCDVKVALQSSFFKHSADHNYKHKHVCRICNKSVNSFAYLKAHVDSKHCNQLIHCNCEKDFYKEIFLSKHINECESLKLKVCPICSINLTNLSDDDFDIHLKSHIDNLNPNIACKICLNYFFSECNVLQHIKTIHIIEIDQAHSYVVNNEGNGAPDAVVCTTDL